jgi:hypothetical protein
MVLSSDSGKILGKSNTHVKVTGVETGENGALKLFDEDSKFSPQIHY